MIKNREVFLTDPMTFTIPNEGVTKVLNPETPEQWDVLRYELSHFVCDGEYREGLERVLQTYLAHLNKPEQPAVWVSGFYGSGKSHFVRVLEYIWRDVELPDGARARGLAKLPREIQDLLRELSTVGTREGGLWSAAGTLGAGSGSIRLAMLGILFRAMGLPTQYAPACFVIWMKQKGVYEAVRAGVEARGETMDSELHNMYVSSVLAKSLLEAYPDFAAMPKHALLLLKDNFPQTEEIDDDRLLRTMEDVLRLQSTTPGKLPCTLLVFDELQQFIGEDTERALQVQTAVEACCARFGSQLLFVGTGQVALEATPQLSKLQDRFSVRVTLSDRDVQHVVREVVLRKAPDKVSVLKDVLDGASGEINRHLGGTKIAPMMADTKDWVPDYPLLPTRRRFWEGVLRAIDRAGTAAQLRTQLRVVHEATRGVGEAPIGTVVSADMIYEQQRPAMLQSGVLLREVDVTISEQDDGTEAGMLRSRLCALIFLIGELPTEGVAATGVRATANTLADLLVEDLPSGSASLRQQVPVLLQELVDDGTLMLVEGEYHLQTRESAEWERDRRGRYARIAADDSRLASDRMTEFRNAVSDRLKGIKLVQGDSKTPRKYALHFGPDMPPTETSAVPMWVRDEWSVSERTVREDAQAAGIESPVVFVLLPRRDADALKTTLANRAAAKETLGARPAAQNTPEGINARRAMQTREEIEDAKLDGLVAGILDNARVFQGGGNEVAEGSLSASVEVAARAALVRLFPNFDMADDSRWGTVVTRARQGAADALTAVGYDGEVAQHPVCREIQAFIGATGKKGSAVRRQFTGAGYGWPQDAVDGALMTLVAGHLVEAIHKNGQTLTAKQIAQSQIGVIIFRNASVIVTASQRIAVRRLITDMGLPVKPGEETEAIPRVLQRLQDLAGEAGGPPPLRLRPSTAQIDELLSKSGSEQFVAVYEARQGLLEHHVEWRKGRELKEARLPQWQTVRRLLSHASGRPIIYDIQPQVDAIQRDRMLLSDPDPVRPLIETLSGDLRQALQQARKTVIEVREGELQALKVTEEWNKLSDGQWRAILQSNNLGPIDELDIGTDELLLAALDQKALTAWQAEAEAIPTRMRNAREQAAKLLEPKAVWVQPRSTTLRSAEEVDAYLDDLRAELMAHIEAGNPVIL